MTTSLDDNARLGADDTQAAQYLAAGGHISPVDESNDGNGGKVPPPLDQVDLALVNRALATENQALKRAAQQQRLGKLVAELRFLGKLTPGLEQAGALELLHAAYALDESTTINQPDGSTLAFGEALANLLYAIPPSWGGEGRAGAAGGAPAYGGQAQTAAVNGYAPLPPRLSAQERDVARTLGLTPEEYAGITQGDPL
jgi:hypothetical protein